MRSRLGSQRPQTPICYPCGVPKLRSSCDLQRCAIGTEHVIAWHADYICWQACGVPAVFLACELRRCDTASRRA
jgi:hypothetical protein